MLSIAGKLFDFRSGVDIARADYCDGFETAGGCQKREQPGCRHFGDIYELKNGYFHATTSNLTVKTDPNISHSISDCKAACWEDCDCLGFIYLHEDQTGCQYWRKGWEFIPQDVLGYSTTSSIFVLVPKESSDGDKNEADTKKWIWIGCVIVGAVLAMLICILCYIRRKNSIISGESSTKIENEFLDLMNSNRSTDVSGIQNDGNTGPHGLRVFSYASIMVATDNFSKERKLGEGGFGPVYKGILGTAREVAVKRLSRCSGQGALEFKNELVLISELQHRNLVQLLGFCIHGEERMLIYEYMPHKSLDCFLFDSSSGFLLDWNKRYNIIEGISQGLLYLHKYSRLRVIHRDLKASNILLNENMNPKISDFGMARIFTHNELEANTNRVVGTYGYMSPEYAMEGIFSTKSDVYSFGVLMLEIISGRRNNSFYNDHHVLNLIGYVWLLWKEGTAVRLMDPALGDSCNKDQLVRCIHVGLLCVEENADDRPTMSDVISMLTNESMPLQSPTKPAFVKGRTIPGEGLQNISVNDISISIVDAR